MTPKPALKPEKMFMNLESYKVFFEAPCIIMIEVLCYNCNTKLYTSSS